MGTILSSNRSNSYANLSPCEEDLSLTGWHPLHVAAYYGHIEEVKHLITTGAYVTAVDARGRTPLHFARVRKHKERNDVIAKMLLSAGADDLQPADARGRTPLDMYIQYNKNTDLPTAKELGQDGAPIVSVNI